MCSQMYTPVYDGEMMAKFAASTTGTKSLRMLVPRVSGLSVVFGPYEVSTTMPTSVSGCERLVGPNESTFSYQDGGGV